MLFLTHGLRIGRWFREKMVIVDIKSYHRNFHSNDFGAFIVVAAEKHSDTCLSCNLKDMYDYNILRQPIILAVDLVCPI